MINILISICNSFTELIKRNSILVIIIIAITLVIGLVVFLVYKFLNQYEHKKCKVYTTSEKKNYVYLYVYMHKSIKNFGYYSPDGMYVKLTDQQCNDYNRSHKKNLQEGKIGKLDIPEFCKFPYAPEPETLY